MPIINLLTLSSKFTHQYQCGNGQHSFKTLPYNEDGEFFQEEALEGLWESKGLLVLYLWRVVWMGGLPVVFCPSQTLRMHSLSELAVPVQHSDHFLVAL